MVQPNEVDAPQPQSGGGIIIENVRSSLVGDGEEDRPAGGGEAGRFPGNGPDPAAGSGEAAGNTLPLDPRVVKFSVGAIGDAAAEMTRYAGWRFKDDELDAIADALSELGFKLPAYANAILVVVAIAAGKGTAYVMWVRAGKPPLAESTRRMLEDEPAAGDAHHG